MVEDERKIAEAPEKKIGEESEKVEECQQKIEKPSEEKIKEPSEKKTGVEDEAEEPKKAEGCTIGSSVSFKEESNVVADLVDPQKKALDELKKLVEDALAKNEFSKPPPPAKEEKSAVEVPKEDETPQESSKTEESAPVVAEESTPPDVVEDSSPPPPEDSTKETTPLHSSPDEVNLWGVPLLGDERSDTILLKFLRARDFKVKEALEMIKSTVLWRKEFGIEKLLEEDLDLTELQKVVFMKGTDREGHPVCYNVYGEFQDKDLFQKVFSDEEKRKKFLQWRIIFLEKGIRELLDFNPGGVSSMVQVADLKNSPTLGKREVRQATNQALHLLQDNYPEFVAKKLFINVPWWYLAYHRMISPFLTQRTKSKFVFAGPSKSAEALFKYIAPEQVPVEFGGLSKDNDSDFSASDPVTEISIKPSSIHSLEIPISEAGSVLTWELRVLNWDASYGAEFVPSAEDGYTVVIQKSKKYTSADEPYVKNSYKIGEPGKVVFTVDNASSRKKKLLYRVKITYSASSV